MKHVMFCSFIILLFSASTAFAQDVYEITMTKGLDVSKPFVYKLAGEIRKKSDGSLLCSFPNEEDQNVELPPNSGNFLRFRCGEHEGSFYVVKKSESIFAYRIDLILNLFNDTGESTIQLQYPLFNTVWMMLPYPDSGYKDQDTTRKRLSIDS